MSLSLSFQVCKSILQKEKLKAPNRMTNFAAK